MISEENAVMTEEKPLLMPLLFIAGTSIFASIAASATDEPLIPPMTVDSRMFVCARPP